MSPMRWKTKTNFFLKHTDQTLLIRKDTGALEANIGTEDYETLLHMLIELKDGKDIDLHAWTKQELKLFKLAVTLNLVYEVKQKSYRFSTYVIHHMENAFERHDEVLEQLENVTFSLRGAPTHVVDFFRSNGLMHSTCEKTVSVYWNDDMFGAPLGSFIVLHHEGHYMMFKKTTHALLTQWNAILQSTQGNKGYLGNMIIPMVLFRFMMEQLFAKEKYNMDRQKELYNQHAASIVFSDGSMQTIQHPAKVTSTFEYYERIMGKEEVKEDNTLAFVQHVESMLLEQKSLVRGMNSVETARKKQLFVSHYQVDFVDSFSSLTVDTAFISAAEFGLVQALESYLQWKENENELHQQHATASTSPSIWIGDRNETHFYLRGMAAFVEEDKPLRIVVSLPASIQHLIQFLKEQTGVEVRIALKSIVGEDIGRMYVVKEQGEVLYESEITMTLLAAMRRGLCKVISDTVNDIQQESEWKLTRPTIMNSSIPYSMLNRRSSDEVQRALMKQLEGRTIVEKPWIQQPLFQQQRIWIGKFTEKGG
ncbi:hypothetical protein [Longirhabdus pacifica]|uniref:hypothetical protein n=1 Tax=Longirhabdus pacifica TaxID=2305227 RepID=UPI001008FA4B|nr:hypothetical protein [Longirhabdus pacifica]